MVTTLVPVLSKILLSRILAMHLGTPVLVNKRFIYFLLAELNVFLTSNITTIHYRRTSRLLPNFQATSAASIVEWAWRKPNCYSGRPALNSSSHLRLSYILGVCFYDMPTMNTLFLLEFRIRQALCTWIYDLLLHISQPRCISALCGL